jgi:hypothetical protein
VAYDVKEVEIELYEPLEDGREVVTVGYYASKPGKAQIKEGCLPSLRYCRLLQQGARELQLRNLHTFDDLYYVTPPAVRAETKALLEGYTEGKEWSSAEVAESPESVTSCRGWVIQCSVPFGSWKNHDLTRRVLLHFKGHNLEKEDVRYGHPQFDPAVPSQLTPEEEEVLWQALDCLCHREGAQVVGRLKM